MRSGWDKQKALTSLELLWKPMYYVLYPLTKFIYRYTPIVPNHITLFNFFVGLSAIFFMTISGHFPGFLGLSDYWLRVIGALLTFCYICLDSMDGQLARGGNLSSEFGAWLDSTLDSVMFPFFMLALAIGVNSYAALAIGAVATLCFPIQFLIQYKFKLRFQDRLEGSPLGTKSRWKYLYGGVVFFWLNLIFAVFDKPLYTLVFFATFGNLFWVGIIFFQYLALRKWRHKAL